METLFLSIIRITINGSIIFGFLFLLQPFTQKRFSAKWHYYMTKVILLFFLFPLEKIQPFLQPIIMPKKIELSKSVNKNWNEIVQIDLQNEKGIIKNSVTNSNIIMIVTTIWLIGICVLLLWHIGSLVYFKKQIASLQEVKCSTLLTILEESKKEIGITRKVKVFYCNKITSPMLIGIRKPKILLPDKKYSYEIIKYIFLHELIHDKRKDLIVKIVTIIVKLLHWINPIIYLFCSQNENWLEYSCDEIVVKNLNHSQRKSYGMAILESVATIPTNYTYISMLFGTTNKKIKRRLKNMLNFKKATKSAKIASIVLAVGIIAGGSSTVFASNNISKTSQLKNITTIIKEKEMINISNEYTKWGLKKVGNAYYYQNERVRILMDLRADNSFVNFKYDEHGTVDLQLLRTQDGSIKSTNYIPKTKVEEILNDLASSKPSVKNKNSLTKTVTKKKNSLTKSPVKGKNLLAEEDIPRLTKEDIPIEVLETINTCEPKTWYVIEKGKYQYIYYNGLPRNYAYQPSISKSNANINIVDIGKTTSNYVLLSISKDFKLTVHYNSKQVTYTKISL